MRRKAASASCKPETDISAAPSAPRRTRGSGKVCPGSGAASAMAASSHSATPRTGCSSHARAGAKLLS